MPRSTVVQAAVDGIHPAAEALLQQHIIKLRIQRLLDECENAPWSRMPRARLIRRLQCARAVRMSLDAGSPTL